MTVIVHPREEKPEAPEVEPGDGFAKNDSAAIAQWRSGLIRVDQNDEIKKMNMKVAGTLGNYLKQKVKVDRPKSPPKADTSMVSESTNNEVYDKSLFEGLTSKQKKNLRKKLQRQRKKREKQENSQLQSSMASSLNQGTKDDLSAGADQEIDAIDIEVGDKQDEKKDEKKQPVENLLDDLKLHDEVSGRSSVNEATLQKMKEEYQELHNKRGRKIDDTVMVKICDMGNGCWTYHHFTPEIQTRQYRSPEVIIGADYNTTADVWSFACTIFEMVTGDFLFEPRKGQNYDKDDDHLAQMMELLGRMPKNLALSGKNSKKFFDSKGHLRKISGLNFWPLKKVLVEKYRIKEDEAQAPAPDPCTPPAAAPPPSPPPRLPTSPRHRSPPSARTQCVPMRARPGCRCVHIAPPQQRGHANVWVNQAQRVRAGKARGAAAPAPPPHPGTRQKPKAARPARAPGATPGLLGAMDADIPDPVRATDKAFQMSNDGINQSSGRGTVLTGIVEQGTVKPGDAVELVGMVKMKKPVTTVVTSIEGYHKQMESGIAGDQVGCLIRGVSAAQVRPGLVICKPGPPHTLNPFGSGEYACPATAGSALGKLLLQPLCSEAGSVAVRPAPTGQAKSPPQHRGLGIKNGTKIDRPAMDE